MTCPRCNQPVRRRDKQCEYCGTDLAVHRPVSDVKGVPADRCVPGFAHPPAAVTPPKGLSKDMFFRSFASAKGRENRRKLRVMTAGSVAFSVLTCAVTLICLLFYYAFFLLLFTDLPENYAATSAEAAGLLIATAVVVILTIVLQVLSYRRCDLTISSFHILLVSMTNPLGLLFAVPMHNLIKKLHAEYIVCQSASAT